VLSLLTGVVAVAALYFLAVDRVMPALRGVPKALRQGETLAADLEFRTLGASQDGEGEGLRRVPSERPSLLLVFSSTCPACYANLAAWQEVVGAAGEAATVLAVTVERDSLAALAYARDHLPGARTVVPTDPRRFAEVLGVSVVPYTVLVAADGRVEFVRSGRLDSASVISAKRALGALSSSSTLR
jgi:hypothetical protein